MINFLNISKQNVTVINGIQINANAHFITDSSQGWIFSNTKAEEGVCEVFIHYISPANNKRMMKEQPLWRSYLSSEIEDEQTRDLLIDHIDKPIFHIIMNVHEKYKGTMEELINFVQGVVRKNNHEIGEIVIDTFVYTDVFQMESSNI